MTMIITTTETIAGKYPKQVLGLVRGNTVRSRWFGRDIAAGLKNLVGGEIKSYTQLVNSARDEAIQRMIEDAEKKGANAIVCMRLATNEMMAGATEILAYGTAVII